MHYFFHVMPLRLTEKSPHRRYASEGIQSGSGGPDSSRRPLGYRITFEPNRRYSVLTLLFRCILDHLKSFRIIQAPSNPEQYRNTALQFFNRCGSSTSSTRIYESSRSQTGCLQGPNNWPPKLDARTHSAVASHRRRERRPAAHPRTILPEHQGCGVKGSDGCSRGKNHHPRPTLRDRRRSALPVQRGAERPVRRAGSARGGVGAAGANDQRAAAQLIGATFIDLRALSAGHSTCAKDADRWVAGIFDTTTPGYNMVLHPSNAGSAFVADQVARAL